MPRSIFKNPSSVSFEGSSMNGVRSFTLTVEGDVDREAADNETSGIVFGVQNKRGTATAEVGNLTTVSGAFSVGEYGSLRCTAAAKYTATASNLTMVVATAYCMGIDYNVPHGDPSGVTVSWEFDPAGLSYA
jgi:hypothetical protein